MKSKLSVIIKGFKRVHQSFDKPIILLKIMNKIISAVIPFISIWFSAQILNELIGARDPHRLLVLVLLVIGLNMVAMIFSKYLIRVIWKIDAQSYYILNQAVEEKLYTMDFVDTENHDIIDMRRKIYGDAMGMGFGLRKLMPDLENFVEGLLKVIISIGFTITLFTTRVPVGSPYAFLDSVWAIIIVMIILGISIFLAPALHIIGGKIWVEASEQNNAGNAKGGFYLDLMHKENSKGKDIRIYNQQSLIMTDTKALFPMALWMPYVKHFGKFAASSTFLSFISNGLIYLFVALKAFAGAFPVGSIVQYVGAITQFSSGFAQLVRACGDFSNNASFLKEVSDFMDIPNKKYLGTIPVEKRDDNEYEIEFHNVSFKYPGSDAYALKNLNLKLHIGQRLAVVGMNGSGKTTMIKLLTRLYDPSDGEITLNGVDIKKYDYDEYMAIFGVVFQDFKLLPFTLAQNVATDVDYDTERVTKCLNESGFNERLSSLPHGIDTHLYKNFEEEGIEVSGGEAQKIALARALYKNTPFIVLDEPTAALDPVAEYEIYTKFNDIVGDKTAVYISHRLASCRFCDDIAVFHEGALVQRGAHDELVGVDGGKYQELWNAQAQYYV